MHWLAIDGEQPIIAENPVPNFRDENHAPRTAVNHKKSMIPAALLADQSVLIQKLFHLAGTVEEKYGTGLFNSIVTRYGWYSSAVELSHQVHPLTMNNLTMKPTYPRQVSFRRPPTNNTVPSSTPPSLPCLAHELSVEQQLYFQMLTETCFNGSEQQRTSAFRSFSTDAALQPLLPRLTLFITQGIHLNLQLRDLRFIVRFLSILKMLTINSHLSFEKHLHLVITSLFTCLMCVFDLPKASSLGPTPEKQPSNSYSTVWIVREQASDLLICFQQKYSHIPNLTERITAILRSSLITNSKSQTYSTVYGCLRTWIAMPCSSSVPVAKDLIQECLASKLLEADFDLDPIQQHSLFKEKLQELIRKHPSAESQSDRDETLLSQ